MSNEELAKKLDENSKKIIENFNNIKNNSDRIDDNTNRIQQNSCALEILRDYKKENKRLWFIVLAEAIVWAIVFVLFHL